MKRVRKAVRVTSLLSLLNPAHTQDVPKALPIMRQISSVLIFLYETYKQRSFRAELFKAYVCRNHLASLLNSWFGLHQSGARGPKVLHFWQVPR